VLKTNCPHIVAPGRILALIRSKELPVKNMKQFVLDECDKMLEQLGRFQVSSLLTPYFRRPEARRAGDIPRESPREASDDVLCHPALPPLQPPSVDESSSTASEAKLTLHGLWQHYVKVKDSEKNRKPFELLDVLEFNQVEF
jgi:ATP-dependent RNA helicase DDX39